MNLSIEKQEKERAASEVAAAQEAAINEKKPSLKKFRRSGPHDPTIEMLQAEVVELETISDAAAGAYTDAVNRQTGEAKKFELREAKKNAKLAVCDARYRLKKALTAAGRNGNDIIQN